MSFLSERKKAGKTQADVAEHLGVTSAAVSMWESGKNMPRANALVRLAAFYGCTVDELLDGENGGKGE